MTTDGIDLRDALRALAADVAGVPADEPEPVTDGPHTDDFAAMYRRYRTELLLGVALLTGRGDAAQDALHIAASEVALSHPAPEATLAGLRRALLTQTRRLTPR